MKKIFKFSIFASLLLFVILHLPSCNRTERINQNSEKIDSAVIKRLGPPPGRYSILNDVDSITLPFHYFGNKFVLNAEMNGKEIKMMVDNGVIWDELLFFGSSLVDSLGMKLEEEVNVIGAGEENGEQSYTASGVSIKFNEIEFFDQKAIITKKGDGLSMSFPGICGQVCGAFFKHFITKFNFDDSTITLYKPEKFHYIGSGKILNMKRDSIGAYSIPVKLNLQGKNEFNYELFIDLGGIFPVSLALNSKIQMSEFENTSPIILGYGASGKISGYKGKITVIKLADYELKDIFSVFVKGKGDEDNTSTTIGLPLLNHFNLIFDYFNEKLYLEPNSKFSEPIIDNK
jgi:hypothetical protein